MKEFLDLGDNVIDTNLKIDNLGRKIYKKLRKKRSHQLSISTYGNMVSCESRNRYMNIRQLKRLIKEAIGDNENLTINFPGILDLFNRFKSSTFQNFIVDSGDHYIVLENDDKQVSITLLDNTTIEFTFYYYELSEDPILIFEVKFIDPEHFWHINLTTKFYQKKLRRGIDLPNGPTQHYELIGHISYLLRTLT